MLPPHDTTNPVEVCLKQSQHVTPQESNEPDNELSLILYSSWVISQIPSFSNKVNIPINWILNYNASQVTNPSQTITHYQKFTQIYACI